MADQRREAEHRPSPEALLEAARREERRVGENPDTRNAPKVGEKPDPRNAPRTAQHDEAHGQPRVIGNVKSSQEHATRLREALRGHGQREHAGIDINVGVRVPDGVTVYPLPAEVIAIAPEYRGYDYFVDDNDEDVGDGVVGELMKVVWPSRKDTGLMTVVVVICLIISGVVVGVYDTVWAFVINKIIK